MATVKSTKERILRRHFRKYTNPVKKKNGPAMAGRITPKKTGNNDPTRSGNRLDQEIKESLVLLAHLPDMTIKEFIESINEFPHKNTLYNTAKHIQAISETGWIEKNGNYINGDETASPQNWQLKEGKLYTKEGKRPESAVVWLEWVKDISRK